jgi:hypothetical protein
VDATFNECNGQWNRRRKFYKECGYAVKWRGEAPAVNTVDSAAAVEAVAAAVAETTEAVEETSGTHGFILD